mgnify:CR=1 FL=1
MLLGGRLGASRVCERRPGSTALLLRSGPCRQVCFAPSGLGNVWNPIEAGGIGDLLRSLSRDVLGSFMGQERRPGVTHAECWQNGEFTPPGQTDLGHRI